jgi:hypothetical protein
LEVSDLAVTVKLTGKRARSGINPLADVKLDEASIRDRCAPLLKKISEPAQGLVAFDRETTDKVILKTINQFVWMDAVFITKDGSTIVMAGDDMEVTISE